MMSDTVTFIGICKEACIIHPFLTSGTIQHQIPKSYYKVEASEYITETEVNSCFPMLHVTN